MINSLLLLPLHVHQHAIQPKHTLLQRARLFANLAWLCRCLPPRLALHHNIEINKLPRYRAHIVLEAERIFADFVRCQDVVALPLARPV